MSTQTLPTADLASETELLRAENASLKQMIATLKEQVEWFKRMMFGPRSERNIDTIAKMPDLPGFVYPEVQIEIEKKAVKEHTRKKPIRNGKDAITLPDDIPVERKVIDIPEEDKVCKETGQPLVKIGEEVTQKLAFKPGQYFIKEIIRPKYVNQKNPDVGVVTADLPESLFPRCDADESFLAEILVRKYGDHLPLYRQSEILSREKIFISRQILCQWVINLETAVELLRK